MTKHVVLRSTISLWLGGALSIAAAGCDPDAEDLGDGIDVEALEDEDAEVRFVEYEVIAELVTEDGSTLVFTREPLSEGSEEYLVGTRMTGPVGGIDYGTLILEQELTPLEVFLAFAPEGAEPPEELQVIHHAIVSAKPRETDELRPLMVPRAISVSAGHLYCDDFGNFEAGVDTKWTAYAIRDQVTGSAGGNHSVSRSGWHGAYGMACNAAVGSSDQKLVSMCRREPGQSWSCESATLDDHEYGWKTWSIVGSGGAYTTFDFQLNGMMINGVSTTSYLGLVVVASIG